MRRRYFRSSIFPMLQLCLTPVWCGVTFQLNNVLSLILPLVSFLSFGSKMQRAGFLVLDFSEREDSRHIHLQSRPERHTHTGSVAGEE